MERYVPVQKEMETSKARHTLLSIFERHIGNPYFTTLNLGLWATYLSSLGINPSDYSSIQHKLLECSFLNISFDTGEVDWAIFDEREHSFVEDVDCLMIPCARSTDDPLLLERGYFCLPGFFNFRAELEGDWRTFLRQQRGSKHYLSLMREMRRLSHYEVRWMPLSELVTAPKLFDQMLDIYLNNAHKFTYPAIHYSEAVLRDLVDSELAPNFHICLTLKGGVVVSTMLCFIDEVADYIAFLVHGVKYESIPSNHNLYKLNYFHVYEYMAEKNLHNFDMARGFVDDKKRLGCNRIIPLGTYLKPLTSKGNQYVKVLRAAIEKQ